jgi:hypothetical protein
MYNLGDFEKEKNVVLSRVVFEMSYFAENLSDALLEDSLTWRPEPKDPHVVYVWHWREGFESEHTAQVTVGDISVPGRVLAAEDDIRNRYK